MTTTTGTALVLADTPPGVIPPGAWVEHADCKDHPDLMHATRGRTVKQALAICNGGGGCPVRRQCRAWADSEEDFTGVAGGQVYRATAKSA